MYKENILKDLYFVFKGDKEKIKLYIAGIGLKKPTKQTLNDFNNILLKQDKTVSNAFYLRKFSCGICGEDFKAYSMLSKTQQIDFLYKDKDYPLLVAESLKGIRKYEHTDPLSALVIVCPRCLYASVNPGNFLEKKTLKPEKGLYTELPPKLKEKWIEKQKKSSSLRRKIYSLSKIKKQPEIFFLKNFDNSSIILRFNLAQSCLNEETDFDKNAYYYKGKINLYLSKLFGKEAKEKQYFKEALLCLKNALVKTDFEAQCLYLISVLSYYLGDIAASKKTAGKIIFESKNILNAEKYLKWTRNLMEEIKKINRGLDKNGYIC